MELRGLEPLASCMPMQLRPASAAVWKRLERPLTCPTSVWSRLELSQSVGTVATRSVTSQFMIICFSGPPALLIPVTVSSHGHLRRQADQHGRCARSPTHLSRSKVNRQQPCPGRSSLSSVRSVISRLGYLCHQIQPSHARATAMSPAGGPPTHLPSETGSPAAATGTGSAGLPAQR